MNGRLVVYVDGTAMDEAEARSLWGRFSAWMEEHRGDLAGFAANEGFASVHPGVEDGSPALYASRTVPQRPYAPVRDTGGSATRHSTGAGSPLPQRKSQKSGRKRRR